MKGLLIKDLLVLRKYARTLLLIFLFYMFFSFFTNDTSFFSGMTVMFFTISTITSFSYDDLAKWNRYARSLPLTKKEIVASKYLLALILAVTGTVLPMVFSLLFISVFGGKTGAAEQLMISYALFAVAVVFMCVMLPFLFKYGVEKSRVILFGVFLIPFIIGFAMVKLNMPMPTEDQFMFLLKLSPVLLILLSSVSFITSCRIYQNKDA